MITAKVTSKGQITLPKKIREKLGVHPGEELGFEEKRQPDCHQQSGHQISL